jgi:hypothetical protein
MNCIDNMDCEKLVGWFLGISDGGLDGQEAIFDEFYRRILTALDNTDYEDKYFHQVKAWYDVCCVMNFPNSIFPNLFRSMDPNLFLLNQRNILPYLYGAARSNSENNKGQVLTKVKKYYSNYVTPAKAEKILQVLDQVF